jgi:hypothetical protein
MRIMRSCNLHYDCIWPEGKEKANEVELNSTQGR